MYGIYNEFPSFGFLDVIKIPVQRFNQGNKPCNSSELNTINIINKSEEWDFISVFPHSDMADGLFKELQQSNKIEVYNKYRAIINKTKINRKNAGLAGVKRILLL